MSMIMGFSLKAPPVASMCIPVKREALCSLALWERVRVRVERRPSILLPRLPLRQDFNVSESKDRQSLACEVVSPSVVFLRSRRIKVLRPVDFHDQPCLVTVEIYDVRTDRVLAPELQTLELVCAEVMPEALFRICLVLSQVPTPLAHFSRRLLH
jgi:hypothetical protein